MRSVTCEGCDTACPRDIANIDKASVAEYPFATSTQAIIVPVLPFPAKLRKKNKQNENHKK